MEFTADTTFKEQLEVIARTGVFVSVHTSALANVQFLQPGSAVFEVVQRNWAWADMDQTFKVHPRQTIRKRRGFLRVKTWWKVPSLDLLIMCPSILVYASC